MSNPVERLHHILSTAKRQEPKNPCRSVWRATLDPEGKVADDLTIGLQVFKVLGLVDECEAIMERESPDADLILPALAQVRKAINPTRLDDGWEHYLRFLTERSLTLLETAARHISRRGIETAIAADVLQELDERVRILRDDVLASTLEQPFRDLVADQLEAIRRATAEYQVRGAAGIRDALAGGIGAVVMARGELPKHAALYDRIMAFLRDVETHTTVALNLGHMAQPAIPQLLEGFRQLTGG